MKCPVCGFEDCKVLDSRPVNGGESISTECSRKGQVGGRDEIPAFQFAEGDSGKKRPERVKGVDFSGNG